MKKLLLFFVALVFSYSAFSQQYTLSGRVTDSLGSPINFSSVYIKNSTYGTTTNDDGIYQFKLPAGTYKIVYLTVGYKSVEKTISLTGNDTRQDIQMQPEAFTLKPFTVKAKDDPAMGIMHQVMNKRKFYMNEVNSYASATYIKGVKQVTGTPTTLLAKGMTKVLKVKTQKKGIVYQSESISSYNFKKPDEIKEIFIASKTAGSDPPFGYNKASDLQLNFYKDLFMVDGLNNHGFVSPIGSYAFIYYKFKLTGRVNNDGKIIDRIEVIPKNGKAVSFHGNIYILEGDARIYAVDLILTKAFNDLNYIDTLRVTQQYVPVKDNVWEPLSFQYKYSGSVQGYKFNGYYLGINNNYKIDTTFAPGYFTGEILHVDTEANTKSKAYWDAIRPVPLSPAERVYYDKSDSITTLNQTQPKADSIQHYNNRFRPFTYLVHGYLATYRKNTDSIFINPLVRTVYYNTVDGYGIYLNGSFSRTYSDNRAFSLTPIVRYSIANKLFSANLHSVYTYDPNHVGKFFLDFGSDELDLNNVGTRTLLFNTLSTLLSEQNFVKYYRSQFGNIGYQYEFFNGLLWNADLSYANRTQLYNNSYNHIFTYSDKHYTSNNPLVPYPDDNRSVLFPQNQALTFNTSFKITFDQQYITRPTGITYLPSLYPVVTLNYRKGISGVLSSDVNYDFLSLDILESHLPLGIFGHSSFEVKGGAFLNRASVYYMDYNHFLGNQGTTSDPTYFGSFHFLPFYTYSTDDPFIEAHFQHNFSGAILDNFPVLRRLKLEEIVGANYLSEKANPNYYEVYAGIKRLIFGVDYGVSYQGNKKYLQGFRIFYGLK